jgi:DNA mismatch endonuclease (patch repair protein)
MTSIHTFEGKPVDEARSRNMRAIRAKDTLPELIVRKWLHQHGFRFRLHQYDLPGNPDIVMPKYAAAIQVRGCFWHSHKCRKGKIPLTRREYWEAKLRRNRERDITNDHLLAELGYRLFVIWECEIKDKVSFGRKMKHISRQIVRTRKSPIKQ